MQKAREHPTSKGVFTKRDFISALKKVSRRIDQPKPSPKSSKT